MIPNEEVVLGYDKDNILHIQVHGGGFVPLQDALEAVFGKEFRKQLKEEVKKK